jgi:hypothetical protein
MKVDRQQRHEAKMAMKLEQKHNRDGNGACSLRIKPGAKISAKQWARLDDRLREKVVKAGGIPPYKVGKKKKARAKQQHEAAQVEHEPDELGERDCTAANTAEASHEPAPLSSEMSASIWSNLAQR